ncbi:MAG: L,D-transpeptidase family protein, partial [Myxococcales bacterium]|nr:L,D-transpeptidase family protein [Myxococcales bacterium]
MLLTIVTALHLTLVPTRGPAPLPEPAPDLRAVISADPALVLDDGLVTLAEGACAMAPAHGVDPTLPCAELDALATPDVSPDVAARTLLALALAFDLVKPLPPESLQSALRRSLTRLARTDGDEFLFTALPAGGDYWALVSALGRYQTIVDAGGFVPVPNAVLKAKVQAEHPAVAALRARLHQEDPAVGGDADPLYGDDVVDGLRRARFRYQLEAQESPKRQLDRTLLGALAVPAEERALELTRALRALRRSGRWEAPYHVLVNLPEFVGRVREADRTVHAFAIVAGSRGGGGLVNATPTLTSAIRTIIFNPQWVVPKRIFRKEMMS